MKKMYCLVVTDDYSRFTWVFFLATKDETSDILKSFITKIENLVDHKVKVIRCDNGTEFRNREMNQFCEMKGILKQFSVARTPQQNRVDERRNMTLIEATRTMLADSKLPTTFLVEAINNACYVQNRVLVVKPQNKTPYELFHCRIPTLSFMRPFRCLVAILNTIDHLGKFDGKIDEGSGPDLLFDIDALTRIMNYKPIVAGTQSNGFAGTKASDNADPKSSHDDGSKPSSDDGKKADKDSRKESECKDHEKEDNVNNTNIVNAVEADMNNLDTTIQVSPIPTTRIHKDYPLDQVIGYLQSATQTRKMSKNLEEHGFEEPKKVIHALKDPSWIEAMQEELLQFKMNGIVIINKPRLVDLGYTQEERIDYDEVFSLVARIEAIRLFLAYASFNDFVVYQMDVKNAFLYEKIEEEVYVCQPPGFEDQDFPDRVYKVEKALYGIIHALKLGMETLSKICWTMDFKRENLTRPYSSKRHNRFTEVKNASTPMETQKPLLKDEDSEEVDVHMYRSMIGSLMYLISSRPDIMFAVSCLSYTNGDYAGASLDRKSIIGEAAKFVRDFKSLAKEADDRIAKHNGNELEIERFLRAVERVLFLKIRLNEKIFPDDNLVDTISEMFTDEHALDYSSPPLWDDYDDKLFDLETVNDDTYDDPFDSKEEKIKDSKILIDELDLPGSSDFLPFPECDSVFYEVFSKVDALPSTNNEDKVFNLGILIHENLFEVTNCATPEKNVKKATNASLILEDFNPPLYELPFHKEVPGLGALLSFLSKNKEKVYNPGIFTSKRVHTSLLPELSHRGPKTFKVIKIFESPMEIFPCSYQEDIRVLDVPCLHFYPP
ncbi:retrovirus-related pol polyprotein from transposon TNT 1-94 [Tanacetum coccineum]